MSDPGAGAAPQPPPPGWQPPPPPASSYLGSHQASYAGAPPPGYLPPATPGAWAPAPGMLGAAHKPGAMPLRPLGLGDMYDAAFRVIRFNPKATVGPAVLVTAVAITIPVLVAGIVTISGNLILDGTADPDDGWVDGIIGGVGSLGAGTLISGFGSILVTGMLSLVTAAAAVGRRLTLAEAWVATHGKRWRLVGLALLLGLALLVLLVGYVLLWVAVAAAADTTLPVVLWGLLSVPAFVCLLAWVWVRFCYLPVPALMLEKVGVVGALRRAFTLTRKQFWRTFGIALLTVVVSLFAGFLLTRPLGLIGSLLTIGVGDQYGLWILLVTQALSLVIASAFITPFISAVTSLQYLDQRMRKEAYDVELMEQAGITAS